MMNYLNKQFLFQEILVISDRSYSVTVTFYYSIEFHKMYQFRGKSIHNCDLSCHATKVHSSFFVLI